MSERIETRRGGTQDTSNVVGALVPAALAVFALWASWTLRGTPAPTMIFVSFGALCVAAAVAVGVFHRRIANPQDYYGGLALVGLALFALLASAELPGMRGFSFGPGTAPRLFAMLLGLTGICVTAMAMFIDGPRVPRFAARGPLLVTASILLFAVTIRPLGLVIASFVMFVFSASGSKETRWTESVLAAAALTLFCTLLFVYLLNLPFQLWPRFTVFGVTIAI